MNRVNPTMLLALLAAGTIAGCDSTEKAKDAPEPAAATAPAPQPPLTVEDSIIVNVTARVKAIDQAARMVTLVDEDGDEVTLAVAPTVTRLHEVRVGDSVNARYRASLLAELRAPTPEEAATPMAVIGTGEATRDSGGPVGTRSQALRVVTTVEAVNVPNMLVTLRGPMGDVATVRGRNRDNIARIRVGDTIVITFTESIAIALEKIAR